jgi:hypothetical protein
MTLKIKEFSRFPLTREDAKRIALSFSDCPDQIDFSDVVSVSHCFADELFSHFAPEKPLVVNASPFVARIVCAAAEAIS